MLTETYVVELSLDEYLATDLGSAQAVSYDLAEQGHANARHPADWPVGCRYTYAGATANSPHPGW